MNRRLTQSLGLCSDKFCSGLLTERTCSCGHSQFYNGIAWLVQSTLASWLCIASVLVKIASSCAMTNPRRTRQEKRSATSVSVTTHLIHWFRVFLPWGFGCLWNLLILNTQSVCFKRTRMMSKLHHNITVHSRPSFSKPAVLSWHNSFEQTM